MMYLVLALTEWENIKAAFGNVELPVNIPKSGYAFMPVYSSVEEAAKDYPNCKILELESK